MVLINKDECFHRFMYSVLIQDCLSPLSMQALPAPPESLCVLDMSTQSDSKEGEGGLYLNIGLQVRLFG